MQFIRSFKHLLRLAESNGGKVQLFMWSISRVFLVTCAISKANNKKLYVFSNDFGHNRVCDVNELNDEFYSDIVTQYSGVCVIEKMNHIREYARFFNAVDSNFNEEYNNFTSQNKKLLQSVYSKYCHQTSVIAKFVYSMVGNSPNLYLWAMNALFKYNIRYTTLYNIVVFSQKYNHLTNKLSKNTITAYNSDSAIMQLIDEMNQLKKNKRANDAINIFNTTQKKLLKTIDMNEKNINVLNRFGKLSEEKKNNFVRKMSTVENIDDIMQQMSFLASIHFEWNRDSLLNSVFNNDGLKCDVVIDRNNIVLMKVSNYDTIKYLAKTTNWCISKNLKYWNDYVKNKSCQYVLFDFNKQEDDELSIVGFTVKKNIGITNAHSFTNKNMLNKGGRRSQLSSFANFTTNGIFDLLKDLGISMSEILEYSENPYYSWSMESVISFLNYCFGDDGFTIHLMDNSENKLVISTKSKKVRYIIGSTTKATQGGEYYEQEPLKYFVFFDFSKQSTDNERIKMAGICYASNSFEEYANSVYDANENLLPYTFDSLLVEFGLPYDTICRTNDVYKRFANAFKQYDLLTLNQLIKDDSVWDAIVNDPKKRLHQYSFSVIHDTIFGNNSFDYINLIYDNGKKLSDICHDSGIRDIVLDLIVSMSSYFNQVGSIPKTTDLVELFSRQMNPQATLWMGYFYIFNKIIENEDKNMISNCIIESIQSCHRRNGVFDAYLLNMVIDKLTFNNLSPNKEVLLSIIASTNDKDLFKAMLDKSFDKLSFGYFICKLSKNSPYYNEFMLKFKDLYGELSRISSDSVTWTYSF